MGKKAGVMAAVVLLGLTGLAACRGQKGKDAREYPTITVCSVHTASAEANQRISEEISRITREKAGCNVKIIGYKMNDYEDELSVLYHSGQLPDVFAAFELDSYERWISMGAVIGIENLLKPYKDNLSSYIRDKEWLIAYLNDEIYGIPSCTSDSKCMGFVFRRDIAEALGIDWRSIKTLDQLHEMLLSVKEHYPDMNIIVPHGGRIIPRMIQDRLGNNIGVLVDKRKDSSVVENFYKSEYFYNLCLQMREWNQQGLFMEKAYMGKEDRQSYLAQGDSFGSFLNLSEISIFNIARYVQYPMAAVQLAPRIADSDSCNMIWCISRDSKNPELAMKVLNLMYTDVEISRLLAYGQEGIDYEFAGAGYVKPADNPDYSPAEQWTSKVWSWPVGVEIEQWQEEDGLLDHVVFWDEPVKDSPALGFLFDVSAVRVEVDACQYIIDKYENALLCGELWPKNGIESFNQELESAGIDRVIAEKQRQLDAFMEKYR